MFQTFPACQTTIFCKTPTSSVPSPLRYSTSSHSPTTSFLPVLSVPSPLPRALAKKTPPSDPDPPSAVILFEFNRPPSPLLHCCFLFSLVREFRAGKEFPEAGGPVASESGSGLDCSLLVLASHVYIFVRKGDKGEGSVDMKSRSLWYI